MKGVLSPLLWKFLLHEMMTKENEYFFFLQTVQVM